MKTLQSITICVPQKDQDFERKFLDFLSKFGVKRRSSIIFEKSSSEYVPEIGFTFGDCQAAEATFLGSREFKISILNTTGLEKKSPLAYTPIVLDDYLDRVESLNFEFIDHIGFDIFWPKGVHPEIAKAREVLSKGSLYYLNQTGENWDFIIPATQEEIKSKELDYKVIRRPKFEIVTLDYTSTPIIQFDMSVKENFEQTKKLFPEGYPDDYLKNVWVYIDNPYGLYICAVIGHRGKADWYRFLKKGLIS
jgi:hypothetical protein